MADLPEVLAAMVLGPEDRLVLHFSQRLSMAEAEGVASLVKQAGLSGRVLFTDDRVTAHVLRATKAEGSTVGQCGDRAPSLLGPAEALVEAWHSCHLAYGHTGMHSDGEATWTNREPVALQVDEGSQA